MPSSWLDVLDAPHVSIDVDGTLALTLHALCAAVNAKCKTQFTYFDCTAQEKAEEFGGNKKAQKWAATFIEYDTGSHKASKGFNKALAPDFAAIAAVQSLYAAGVYVHICTHRDAPLEGITRWWLKKWQVPYNELHVSNTSKEDLAKRYQEQGKKIVFVDDSTFLPKQIEPYAVAYAYMLRRPNTFLIPDKGDNYEVIDTWQPVLECADVTQGTVPQLSEPIANKGKVNAAGICVLAKNTGRVLMLQRSIHDDAIQPAAGKWEFPGGKADPGESLWDAALREWQEETGNKLPDGKLVETIEQKNGYTAFVYIIPLESDITINVDSDAMEVRNPDHPRAKQTEVIAWWGIKDAKHSRSVRDEFEDFDWGKIKDACKDNDIKPVIKRFGDPGSTQERVEHGEFGPSHTDEFRANNIGHQLASSKRMSASTSAINHLKWNHGFKVGASTSIDRANAMHDSAHAANKSFGDPGNEQTRVDHGEFGASANDSLRDRVAHIATHLLHGQLHAQGTPHPPTHDFLHALAEEAMRHAVLPIIPFAQEEGQHAQGIIDQFALIDHLIAGHNEAIMQMLGTAKFDWLIELFKSFGDPGNTQERVEGGRFGAASGNLASEGKAMLDARSVNASKIVSSFPNHTAFTAAQQSWGGVTIDTHTGEIIEPTTGYAVTAREPGQQAISIPENATEDEFNAAMQQARDAYPQLANEGMNLGVFHDDDKGTIDIDPTVVVATTHEVDAIVAYNGATGGAYGFATGNGYWPPGTKPAEKFEWLDLRFKNILKSWGDPGNTQERDDAGRFGVAMGGDSSFKNHPQGAPTAKDFAGKMASLEAKGVKFGGVGADGQPLPTSGHLSETIQADLQRHAVMDEVRQERAMAIYQQYHDIAVAQMPNVPPNIACAMVAVCSQNNAMGPTADGGSPTIGMAVNTYNALEADPTVTITQEMTEALATNGDLAFPAMDAQGHDAFDQQMQPGDYKLSELSPMSAARMIGAGLCNPVDDCVRMYRGESPDDVIDSPKLRNFADNITYPNDPTNVTCDRWAARSCLVGPDTSFQVIEADTAAGIKGVDEAEAWRSRGKTNAAYSILAENIEYFASHNALNPDGSSRTVIPDQAQAITWAGRGAYTNTFKKYGYDD